MTRIKWSLNEERDLAAKMFARWKQVPMDSPMETYTWVMNNQWPEERRRKIAGLTVIPETRKIFLKLVSDHIAKGEQQAAPAETQKDQPKDQEMSMDSILGLLNGLVVEKPVPFDATALLRAQPDEVLIQEFFARRAREHAEVMNALHRIEDAVTERRPQHQPTIPRPIAAPVPVAPRKTTTRIAVLGLLPDQFHHVEMAVAGRAELVLVKNEQTTDAKNFNASVDYAVINIKFVSHEQQRAMSETVGKDRVVLVHGGVSSVTKEIFDILSRQRV